MVLRTDDLPETSGEALKAGALGCLFCVVGILAAGVVLLAIYGAYLLLTMFSGEGS